MLTLWFFVGAAGIAFGWRAFVIAPREAAAAEWRSWSAQLAPILGSLHTPLLAVPAFGAPIAGDPTASALTIPSADRAQLESAEQALGRLESRRYDLARVGPLLGSVRFALGQDRQARLAWEGALTATSEANEAEARIGLAAVALRSALRQQHEQDRKFAAEHALHHLGRLPVPLPDPVLERWRAFDLAVARALLGDAAATEAALAGLSDAEGGPVLVALVRSALQPGGSLADPRPPSATN